MVDLLAGAKHGLFELTRGTGVFDVIRFVNGIAGKRLTIVTYHRVTDRKVDEIDDSFSNLFVTVDTFEKQIVFFKKHYHLIDFRSLRDMAVRGAYPPSMMLITFDDGYLDFCQHAYPVLKKHDAPASLFVVPGKMGSAQGFPFWWDELYRHMMSMKRLESNGELPALPRDIQDLYLRFKRDVKRLFDSIMDTYPDSEIEGILSGVRSCIGERAEERDGSNSLLGWEDVRRMSDLVEIGSHTMRHRNVKFLSGEELREEVRRSKEEIERNTGREVIAFSYPNGYYNDRVVTQVRDAGYTFAVTTDNGINDLKDRFRMKRVNLWERSSSVARKPFSEGKLSFRITGLA